MCDLQIPRTNVQCVVHEPLAPAGDPDLIASVLSDRTRRGIYLYVKQQRDPVGVNQVAERFSLHRNAAKFHLDKLLGAGLLRAEFRRINGRRGPGAGRPSKLYSGTDVEVSISIPDRRYELLAELLLRALTSGRSLEEVGYEFGTELAAAAPETGSAAERARAVLDRLGFEPSIEVDRDGGTWITTENCPFGKVAMEAPEGEVCRLDRAIVRGVLEASSGEAVEVREHMAMTHGHEVCVRQVVTDA
jgi:predicted ArsR family transcriptional regulator